MRQTNMQRLVNNSTGVNWNNPGFVRMNTNAHMRSWANLIGGRVRTGAGGSSYVSNS